MSIKSVGIDVGTYSIKIVEILSSSKGFQILQYFEHPMGLTAGSDPELEVLEFLRGLPARFNPSTTRFVMGIRQDKVAVRFKTFPFSDRNKIARSLTFELEDDLPFSAENAVFDAKILRTAGVSAEVLACAAPKPSIKAAIQRCQDGRFEPYAISPEGLAFSNCLERWNEAPPSAPTAATLTADAPVLESPPRRPLQVVLNIGHSRTIICAYNEQVLLGVHTILWGGKNIADAIAKKYEIPFIESIKELQTKAFILTNKTGATQDQIAFSDLIAGCVREMVRDLQLYLLETMSEFHGEVVNITLTGGTSQIINLGPFLTQHLEIPCNRLSVLSNFPSVVFEVSPRIDATIGPALGLAIEGVKRPRNPTLTFLRGEFTPQNKALIQFWDRWGHLLKISTAGLCVIFVYSYVRSDFALRLAERGDEVLKIQAKNIAHLQGKNATEKAIREYNKKNRTRAADLRRLAGLAKIHSALDALKSVSETAPQKAEVTLDVRKFKLEDTNLVVEGFVNNQTEITRFQKALESISSDGKISVKASTLTPPIGKVAFHFVMEVDRGQAKEIQGSPDAKDSKEKKGLKAKDSKSEAKNNSGSDTKQEGDEGKDAKVTK